MPKQNRARNVVAALVCGLLAFSVAMCGHPPDDPGGAGAQSGHHGASGADGRNRGLTRIPGIGKALRSRIPAASGQVLAVYGAGKDSPYATVELYARQGTLWHRTKRWVAHNGRKGWTADHHEGDKRSPVGVFTLSDAGGVLPDPGARLPYTASASFQAPHSWARSHWHDFDYVIAIDFNRVRGRAPNDPERPEGQSRGGSIWLHLDHGSGTSACVGLPRQAMVHLLKTLDPAEHPVVVMGDRASLAG